MNTSMDKETIRRKAVKGRKQRKKIQRRHRQKVKEQGMERKSHTSRPNRTSSYQTVDEEKEARTEAVIEHARLIRRELPVLLERLSEIPDPRNPKLISHTMTCLLVYGILMFVLQTGSRRKSNEQLSAPEMFKNLGELFPDLQSIPHHDTLYRFLSRIDVQKIEEAQIQLVGSLIVNKKLSDYRREGRYVIAIDGTQKLVSYQPIGEQWLQREVGSEKSKRTQYYVGVLEANLVLTNGLTIPLMSEFLDREKGDTDAQKQDCEQRAFMRLSQRLKKALKRLPIVLVLDGLYPTGPVMRRCKDYHWDFMIVLKDNSLPYAWEEYKGLSRLEGEKNRLSVRWNGKEQRFQWVNDIEYRFGKTGGSGVTFHVVVCQESWEEIDENREVVVMRKRFAWISDKPLEKDTVHERCNLIGRRRWGIEESFQVEKPQGYNYEHRYSDNWNAMRGYHYLMRIGHLLNVLAQLCVSLVETFRQKGPQGFIGFVRSTLEGAWFQGVELTERLAAPYQLRLVYDPPASPLIL